MGQIHSVTLANCFMSFLLQDFLAARPQWLPFIDLLCRFLDDLLGFWRGSRSSFDDFFADLNHWSTVSGHQVQFELTCFGQPAPFLDIELYRNASNVWHTRVFYKRSDVHAFLSPASNHPPKL
eukprot:4740898-Lingulodinium_polyedra.AAC.1